MLRLELVGLVLLACTQILTEHRSFYGSRNQYGHRTSGSHHGARTREVQVKYGRLRGTVIQPKPDDLQLVDVFLGVPYAEPPAGPHRFEPPTTQTPWTGVRNFVNFAPVCPQLLPRVEEEVDPIRHKYLKRLLPYLQNQSEDCLYLNIYAPHQNSSQKNNLKKYPVIVFIHGESYEWNSGNPYDGSVLAAYGNIVFVTVNFRLGILGFLRPGIKDNTVSNFGLLDQIAALDWLQENIGHFGGDPSRITLLGHGTGAVFVNLLLLSPISIGKELFRRAILMSGSALNPDAIGKAPLQITGQVAYALNCPQNSDEDLVACLKTRSVQDLLRVKIEKPKYVPAFAPLVDPAVIPDKPINLMNNAESLTRFDLMYGVTELEKFHALPGVALLEGLSKPGRDEFIRDSVKATHELEDKVLLRKVLDHYEKAKLGGSDRPRESDEYEWNRDLALEVVSDSAVVAPLIATANLHSRANPKSYMYVFSHLRSIRDDPKQDFHQQIRHTVHGEELPYVLGIPLDGEGYHLSAAYDEGEALLSKAMMDWWCNFAYSGNPNNVRLPPARSFSLRDDYKADFSYQIDWPEYDPENQTYFNLTTPARVGHRYRAEEMEFWNEAIPHLLRRPKAELSLMRDKQSTTTRRPRPALLDAFDRDFGSNASGLFGSSSSSASGMENVFHSRGNLTGGGEELDPAVNLDDGKGDPASNTKNAAEGESGSGYLRNSSAISLVIGLGLVFLLINATALVYLYRKRQRMRKKASAGGGGMSPLCSEHLTGGCSSVQDAVVVAATLARRSNQSTARRELGYCYSASKPDIREIIKNDKAYDNNSNFGRRSRENSSSTIDTRVKVREWIQQEIVHRCSPRFLRKTRETLQREHREKLMKQSQKQQSQHQQQQQQIIEGDEQMYGESQQIRVRPGVRKPAASKVSVAVDATPASLTDSILNQIPIEVARAAVPASSDYLNSFEDAATAILGPASEYCEPAEFQTDQVNTDEGRGGPNIVVIEHHHSRSDPLPMDKVPNYGTSKALSTSAKIHESDSGSASSLYARINPKKKSRLPLYHQMQREDTVKEEHQDPASTSIEVKKQHPTPAPIASGVLASAPRLLTFGSQPNPSTTSTAPAIPDVNVTSRDASVSVSSDGSVSHEEALRTIRRRNYPKVLPDIEKRRSLPPNASFVAAGSPRQMRHQPQQQQDFLDEQKQMPMVPPLLPPRLYGTSRSLDCVEDVNEDEDDNKSSIMPVTTNLHVGPLKKKDSPKNKSVPSLVDLDDGGMTSSTTSLSVCPVHGTSREHIAPAKSEPRIVITPLLDNNEHRKPRKELINDRSVDQPDCPQHMIPDRPTKLPRIIIKPTMNPGPGGTLPRSRPNQMVITANPVTLHDNETYQRLLARREKMPLPSEPHLSRIPSRQRGPVPLPPIERAEVIQRVNVHDAAATKL